MGSPFRQPNNEDLPSQHQRERERERGREGGRAKPPWHSSLCECPAISQKGLQVSSAQVNHNRQTHAYYSLSNDVNLSKLSLPIPEIVL